MFFLASTSFYLLWMWTSFDSDVREPVPLISGRRSPWMNRTIPSIDLPSSCPTTAVTLCSIAARCSRETRSTPWFLVVQG